MLYNLSLLGRLGVGRDALRAWLLLALFVRITTAHRRAQQDSCTCAWCVQNIGGGYCKGDECTIRHCTDNGFDCACYMPCPCATCVRKGGEQPYCESIWTDCSCVIPDDGSSTPPAPCGNLNDRIDAVNGECCDEPSEDCSSGSPSTCNPSCAHVVLPFFEECSEALGDLAGTFDGVANLCHQATCPQGAFQSKVTFRCEACPLGLFKAEEGLQECTECLAGTTTTVPGSIRPNQCVPPPPPPTAAGDWCPPIQSMFTPDDHIVILRACDVAVEPGGTCMVGCDIAHGYTAASGLPGTKFTCGVDGAWQGTLSCTKRGGH